MDGILLARHGGSVSAPGDQRGAAAMGKGPPLPLRLFVGKQLDFKTRYDTIKSERRADGMDLCRAAVGSGFTDGEAEA